MSEPKPANQPSLEPSGDAVKEAKPVRIFSWLQGWEAGGITIGLVVAAALLSVPRAAAPKLFPVPLLDVQEATSTRLRAEELADEAERSGLPFETRAVGDAVRRWGVALSSGVGDVDYLKRLTQERVEAAVGAGQVEALARLRAVQSRLFVRSVRGYGWSGPEPLDLRELGGDFARRALANGWVERGGCLASDDELMSLYGVRWLELTHLREHPRLRPSLGELRRYYRFLLLYPEQGKDAGPDSLAKRRLSYVEALTKVDGEYPVALARGALLGQLGQSEASAAALSGYLGQTGDDFRLRARNYLLFAARDLPDMDGEPPSDRP